MSVVIVCPIHDTLCNGRLAYTRRLLDQLDATIPDDANHHVIVVDCGSHGSTRSVLREWATNRLGSGPHARPHRTVEHWPTNVGRTRVFNHLASYVAWRGAHWIWLDNDVVFDGPGWVEAIETAFRDDPKLGIVALKARGHECKVDGPGGPNVEYAPAVIGMCMAVRREVVQQLGGHDVLPGPYGFDDCLYQERAILAGWKLGYLIEPTAQHDDAADPDWYRAWKRHEAERLRPEFERLRAEYQSGRKPLRIEP